MGPGMCTTVVYARVRVINTLVYARVRVINTLGIPSYPFHCWASFVRPQFLTFRQL